MAGPELTEYLKASDFEHFKRIVRHYNHDVANRISRITTECSILTRIAERIPPEEVFTDPAYYAEGPAAGAEAKVLVDALSNTRQFFYPPGDTDAINRARWRPYDAAAWDKMIGEFTAYLAERLGSVETLFERLYRLENAGVLKIDGRGKSLASARVSISNTIGELEELLTPPLWEQLLPEWLNRPE